MKPIQELFDEWIEPDVAEYYLAFSLEQIIQRILAENISNGHIFKSPGTGRTTIAHRLSAGYWGMTPMSPVGGDSITLRISAIPHGTASCFYPLINRLATSILPKYKSWDTPSP